MVRFEFTKGILKEDILNYNLYIPDLCKDCLKCVKNDFKHSACMTSLLLTLTTTGSLGFACDFMHMFESIFYIFHRNHRYTNCSLQCQIPPLRLQQQLFILQLWNNYLCNKFRLLSVQITYNGLSFREISALIMINYQRNDFF